MLNIAVVGLGLIGGSIAGALKKSNKYKVDGANRSRAPIEFAIENGLIDGEAKSLSDYDVVFVALPPEVTMRVLNDSAFADGAIVADICGIKGDILSCVRQKKRNYRYVGTHPMAGKEVSGVNNASPDLFRGANMVLTRDDETDEEAFKIMRELTRDMGFGRIVECDAAFHDKKIALTSQLAHIVSNAYVKSPEIENCLGFTGGSFQDMTRIAAVDECVWTELYMHNQKNLESELSLLIQNLQAYCDALRMNSPEKLAILLKEGREIKQKFDS